MEVEEKFVAIAGLLCEPARARILWQLLGERAYTASELAIAADISATSASNHLSRLLEANLVKVETQGRHRYYALSTPDVAYVVEALANLANLRPPDQKAEAVPDGVQYCRTCYDHLAGFVGVKIAAAMEQKEYLRKSGALFLVTDKGWNWLAQLGINSEDLSGSRRPLARQCLDWSERRPHLAGQLGAALLNTALEKNWFKKKKHSRELILTSIGQGQLKKLLGIEL